MWSVKCLSSALSWSWASLWGSKHDPHDPSWSAIIYNRCFMSCNREKFDSHYHNFSSMSWLFMAMFRLYLIFFLEIENSMNFCLTVDCLKLWFQLPAICWNHFATPESLFIVSCVASQVLAHHWPWTIRKKWKMKIFHVNTAVQYLKNRTCIANTWRTILTVIIQADYLFLYFYFLFLVGSAPILTYDPMPSTFQTSSISSYKFLARS